MAPGALYKAQGGNPDRFALSANTQVPPNIKCCRCGQVKGKDAFSNKQQKDLVEAMKQPRKGGRIDPVKTEFIPCIACSAHQVVELECSDCGKTKAVSAFNKTQRKSDDPICEKCGEEKRNMEPEADDSDAEDEGSDYTTDSDGDRFVVDTDFEGGSSTFGERSGTSGAGTFLPSTSGSAGGVRLNSTNPSASSSTAGTSTSRQSGSTTGVASEARRVTPSVTDIPARGTQWAKPPKAPAEKKKTTYDRDDLEVEDSDSDEDD